MSGLQIGVLRQPGFDAPVDAAGIAAVERASEILSEAGAEVEAAAPALPDARAIFGRVWGVALAALVDGIAEDKRPLLDPGLRQVAAACASITGAEVIAGEAMRLQAGHAMARLHRRFDLVLCPTVPGPPPHAGAQPEDAVLALWQDWAPWTFLFNLTRQPAVTVPVGGEVGGQGLPQSVQIAAPLYRDDLALRAALAIERAAPLGLAPFASPSGG